MPTETMLQTSVPPACNERSGSFRRWTRPDTVSTGFGWTSYDAFQQHDVQELSRKLLDNIEEKMKETRSDGVIGRLLKGEIRNY